MTNRLRIKVTLGTAGILGALFLVLGMFLVKSQQTELVDTLRNHGNHIAALTARSSAEYVQRFSFFLMEDQAMAIEQSPDIAFCEIYDAEGKPLLQSGNIVSKDHAGKQTARYDKDILVVSQPIRAEERVIGRVEIGMRLDSVEQAIRIKTTHLTMLFSGFTLFVVVVLNVFFHSVFIKPVRTITDGTQRVARRDFVTIDVGSRDDDLGLLARNFNEMSASLQELYDDLEGKVKQRTQDLEQANDDLLRAIDKAKAMAEKAEAGTLAKSQFLAAMSHEIRTPMNAVLGMGEILQDSELNDEQRRYVTILLESGNALLGLIDDILDLSKIEAGEMTFENTSFALEDVVDKSFKVTAYAGHQKGLDLDYLMGPDVPPTLYGDPLRLQQILINLLGNGIKFTDQGHVILEIDIAHDQEATDDGTVLTFCVHDTGVGVSQDKVETIFNKFTQADASTTRRHGGTGLGLSICQSLCEKLGGHIWMESQAGQGSSFCFTLPYKQPENASPPPPTLQGARLLLMDDRDLAPDALAARMTRAGAEVEYATTLEQGIRTARKAVDEKRPFDGVIVTAPLQGQDWADITATLIEGGTRLDNVILLMANGVEHVSQHHPFAKVLAKPASIVEIQDAVASSSCLPQVHGTAGTADLPDDTPLSILLVEDSTANGMLIELYLKDSDHQLCIAENGALGFEQFTRGDFDIVFMDVEMPVMDGFECTRRIRRWEAENGRQPVPVIALTAHALKEVKKDILESGCTGYLTKPITREEFLHSITASGLAAMSN